METGNYIAELNELAMKRKWVLTFEDVSAEGPDHLKTFVQRAVLNGQVYPNGTGNTKKEAKQKAAKNALTCLKEKCDQAESTTAGNVSQPSCHQTEKVNQKLSAVCNMTEKMNVKPKEPDLTRNYIGLINNYCQKINTSHNFIEVERRGPSHNFVFFYKIVIKNKEYPVGQGITVKEARQNAAALAWSALQEQSDWDSKMSIRSTVSEGEASARRSTDTTPLDYVRAFAQVKSVTSIDSAIIIDSPNKSKDEGSEFENVGSCHSKPSTQSRFTSTYESIKHLGKGGFGSVYKVRHKLLEKDYAVKIVRGKEKALREVKALSDLHHRNILRYYTCWLEDTLYQMDEEDDSYSSCSSSTASSQTNRNSSVQYLYIEMELCDTKTLEKWINEMNEKTVSDFKRRADSLKFTQQIASGVEYIHSWMLIHRDLKPVNIMFGLDEQVKIGDFGLVTDDSVEDEVNLVLRTDEAGTTSYMAPEQKSEKYDRKVDIFSLGLIYFELLWAFVTVHEKIQIWDSVRSQELPREFSVVFPEENQLIVSMLCKKPEERPEARNVKEKLKAWAHTFDTRNQADHQVEDMSTSSVLTEDISTSTPGWIARDCRLQLRSHRKNLEEKSEPTPAHYSLAAAPQCSHLLKLLPPASRN